MQVYPLTLWLLPVGVPNKQSAIEIYGITPLKFRSGTTLKLLYKDSIVPHRIYRLFTRSYLSAKCTHYITENVTTYQKILIKLPVNEQVSQKNDDDTSNCFQNWTLNSIATIFCIQSRPNSKCYLEVPLICEWLGDISSLHSGENIG